MPNEFRIVRSPAFALAVALAALAGWVDAIAFVRLAHTYVSFMSGNSTTLAASLGARQAPKAALLVCVLAGFVAGVVAGEGVAIAAGRRGHAVVLVAESLVLGAAMCAGLPRGSPLAPAALLAFALGIQNASVHEAAGIGIAVTYVTGTLVRLGRRVASALAGKTSWSAPLPYLLLWLGLMAGAAAGAELSRASATLAIAVAALAALGLAVAVGFAMEE